jgi:hypothetical protein
MAAFTDDEKAMYVALVCRSMKDGMTARKAAAMHGVPISSVWDWCHANPVWLGQYEEARGALYRHWEEDIVEISDEQHVGQIVKDKMLGREIETRDMTDHRRLRVESRKWLLSKLKARQYGDKLALGGADDLPPIQSKADVTLAPEDAYKQMIGIGGNGRT